MPYWNQQPPYVTDKAIIAFADGVQTPISLTIGDEFITAGATTAGRKTVPAGLFVAKTFSGAFRFLPRVKALTSSLLSATLSVNPAYLLVPGDVITALQFRHGFTLTGTFAVGESLDIVLNNSLTKIVFTSAGLPIAAVIESINNSALSDTITAIAGGTGEVVLLGNKLGISFSLAVADNSTTGTITAGSAITGYQPIGTVISVAPSTNTVVLAAASAFNVFAGMSLGVITQEVLGLYTHSIDFTNAPSKDLAICIGANGVYKTCLPYIDEDLLIQFSALNIRDKF